MAGYYRAFAFDYDGTLTQLTRPSDATLNAISSARQRGDLAILATGRILSELRADFPDVDDHFDAIVAENGAVVSDRRGKRALVDRVPRSLEDELLRRGVPVRAGDVLLACDGTYAHTVFEAVTDSGLECQIVRNRSALMVLPSGVTKGTGLFEILGDLGVSRHSTIAIGDAENDHTFLDVCEVGVAVANAVPSLKAHADLVLDTPDGEGVTALLNGPIGTGSQPIASRRWRLAIGTDSVTGEQTRIPASQANIVILGASGAGKSHLAGLIVEQLTDAGYSTLVVDVEGEHEGLTQMRGVLKAGSDERLPTPQEVPRLLRHRFGSVVLDLCHLGQDQRSSYLAALPAVIEAERARTGLPHWAVLDEAHCILALDPCLAIMSASAYRGYLMITYRADALDRLPAMCIDVLILLPETDADQIEAAARLMGVAETDIEASLAQAAAGDALLIREGQVRLFTVGQRRTAHERHQHKYMVGELPDYLRFYFNDENHTPARNLPELAAVIEHAEAAVVLNHCLSHDFSRWITTVLHEGKLGRDVLAAERRCHVSDPGACQSLLATAIGRRAAFAASVAPRSATT
jgi:hydroxymethylpyrimidine pyrophosphatase-like HAD family hydrolase